MKKFKEVIVHNYHQHQSSGGALILRVMIGLTFLIHGYDKLADIAPVIKFFGSLGLSPFQAYLVGWVELVGGALLILGLFMKPSTIALMTVMAVAVFGVPGKSTGLFWGHEYEFVLLIALLGLYVLGSGRYSLLHVYHKYRHGTPIATDAK
ncbi:MAG: DoxX family protein [Candidatus Paceibacterota bacterium]